MSGFEQDRRLDAMAPGVSLAAIVAKTVGSGCQGLSDDAVTGVLARAAACEAWLASVKLEAVLVLLRRRGIPALGTRPDGLPVAWRDDLSEEVADALGISRQAADQLVDMAWSLAARLPRTAAALRAGVIDFVKARIITDETKVLDDAAAGKAEDLVAGKLAGKTPGQIRKLIAKAAVRADPEAAVKRREDAQQHDARVACWREPAGTAAIGIFGAPPDAAAAAEQAVQDRAAAYKQAGITGTADQLRQRAALDKLAGTDARGPAFTAGAAGAGGGLAGSVRGKLTLNAPLWTVAGLMNIPGELAGTGPIDPALTRDLASRIAAAGDGSEIHLTLTNEQGWAIGHGCATANPGRNQDKTAQDGQGQPGGGWEDTTWGLTVPGGRQLTFRIYPIPAGQECDHRYQAAGHDPGKLLRHLTQVLYGTCTQPCCARPAHRADYEHNIPFEKGGATCLCNGDSKCDRDHQIKQHPDWHTRVIKPGIIEWTTPSGRKYTTTPAEHSA
jgi:hypothetical protein